MNVIHAYLLIPLRMNHVSADADTGSGTAPKRLTALEETVFLTQTEKLLSRKRKEAPTITRQSPTKGSKQQQAAVIASGVKRHAALNTDVRSRRGRGGGRRGLDATPAVRGKQGKKYIPRASGRRQQQVTCPRHPNGKHGPADLTVTFKSCPEYFTCPREQDEIVE